MRPPPSSTTRTATLFPTHPASDLQQRRLDYGGNQEKADRGEEADEAFQQEENNPRHRAISAARPLPGQLNLGVAVRPRQLARRRAICAESRRPPGGAENRRMKKTLLSLLRRPRPADRTSGG